MERARRRELKELLHSSMMQYLADSSDSSSDEEEIAYSALAELSRMVPQVQLGPRLNLEDMTSTDSEQLFRFSREDMLRLSAALAIPDKYTCASGTTATGMEALMILLRRLAYPNRLCELTKLFGRSPPELSTIFNTALSDIHRRFAHLLTSFDLVWLDKDAFASAIQAKGAPLQNCFGFIDGTVRQIARPTVNQRLMFSGHKRVHCLKFQAVTTPNGLITHLYGPVEGRRHDAYMLSKSGLNGLLCSLTTPNGQPYVLYGDPAYGVNLNILSPFRGQQLTQAEQEFNRLMSGVRVSVEWSFGKIAQLFAFLDFKKNQKILLQPIGKYYIVGALFANCHTCLYGSLTSQFFNVQPPELEVYLNN